MNEIIKQIINRINNASQDKTFLDVLFGSYKREVLNGKPVVLFGAGVMGEELCSTMQRHGIFPVCFCDNNESRIGGSYRNIPIIQFDKLKELYKESLIVIATRTYAPEIKRKLLENGFHENRIICSEFDAGLSAYMMDGSQVVIEGLKEIGDHKRMLALLKQNEQKISDAYCLLSDRKSKELFIARLAYISSYNNLELLKELMMSFSEPVLEFGITARKNINENYYYFNNDVLTLSNNEVYVDAGAFDGDSITTFVQVCKKNHIQYKHIYAFEPDPQNYGQLVKNTRL